MGKESGEEGQGPDAVMRRKTLGIVAVLIFVNIAPARFALGKPGTNRRRRTKRDDGGRRAAAMMVAIVTLQVGGRGES